MVVSLIIMIALLFVREDSRADVRPRYRFERPTDWAEDSTVSSSRKEYYEYVYTKEIEDYKRKRLN
jgi:hypothetical protein